MHIFPGFSAEQSLSLSTDGPIDPALMAAARAYDRERDAKCERAATVRVGRIVLKRRIAIALMAQEIGRIAVANGCVTSDDFKRLGLDAAQIEELSAEAYALAVLDRPGLVSGLASAA